MRFETALVIVFISALMIGAPDSLAQDQVYRWVDENGIVHFGDLPPENSASESVSIPQSAGISAQTPADTALDDAKQTAEPQPSLAQQLRDERAEARRKAEEQNKLIAEACVQRRTLVSQLEPSTRVMVKDEDGKVTRLDDNVRIETLNEAKSYIAKNCDK